MLRQTWFWEVEVVRIRDGEQAGPAMRLDFSVKPLNYLLGGLAAGGLAAAGLAAALFLGPGQHEHGYEIASGHGSYFYWGEPAPLEHGIKSFCGCGVRSAVDGDFVTPLRSQSDTTLLVRRMP